MANFTVSKQSFNKHKNMKMRESGIELLRVISIIFVVIIHEITTFLDPSNLFVVISRVVTWPAIFSFAFITGYFLIFKNDTESRIKRFLWQTFELVIWRILIAALFLFVLSLIEHYSISDFFAHFFGDIILTLFDVKAWYFWAIIFIYLIFPFFAYYLKHNYQVGKKLLLGILITLFLLSIIAVIAIFLIPVFHSNFSLYQDWYTLVIVLLPALLGGYWYLIEQEKRLEYNWKLQTAGLIGLLIIYMINFSCFWWLKQDNAVLTYSNPLWSLAGWCYFLIFKGFKFHSKFINYWAGLSWGIYIIHNGGYLPRGWAPMLVREMQIDSYLSTVLTIIFCYVFSIILVLLIKNFQRFVFQPYIFPFCKNCWIKIFHCDKRLVKIKS